MIGRIIKAELWKLKRYHILWAGILLMLLSVVLTLFSSTAQDGSVWTFSFLVEQVIKNNTTTIFPMCIALIAGYMIDREQTDDTLKNIMTIPVTYRSLLGGKLVVCGGLSLLFGFCCTIFTVAGEMLVWFPECTAIAILQAAIQIPLNCFFLYIAVLPVIIAASAIPGGHMIGTIIAFVYGYGGMFAASSAAMSNIYPITASLGMVLYRSYEVRWDLPLCCASMAAVVGCSVILLTRIGQNSDRKRNVKRKANTPLKKGW